MSKNFIVVVKQQQKTLQELSSGDILKWRGKDRFYELDYTISEDWGDNVFFKCPFWRGYIAIRKKYLYNFFDSNGNKFILYEKVKNG